MDTREREVPANRYSHCKQRKQSVDGLTSCTWSHCGVDPSSLKLLLMFSRSSYRSGSMVTEWGSQYPPVINPAGPPCHTGAVIRRPRLTSQVPLDGRATTDSLRESIQTRFHTDKHAISSWNDSLQSNDSLHLEWQPRRLKLSCTQSYIGVSSSGL